MQQDVLYLDKTQKHSSSQWWMRSPSALGLIALLVLHWCTHSCRGFLKSPQLMCMLTLTPDYQMQWAAMMRPQNNFQSMCLISHKKVFSTWLEVAAVNLYSCMNICIYYTLYFSRLYSRTKESDWGHSKKSCSRKETYHYALWLDGVSLHRHHQVCECRREMQHFG